MNQTITQRLAWPLSEISAQTGLSISFLRGEVRRGRLRGHKFGARVLILDSDLREYMEAQEEARRSG